MHHENFHFLITLIYFLQLHGTVTLSILTPFTTVDTTGFGKPLKVESPPALPRMQQILNMSIVVPCLG